MRSKKVLAMGLAAAMILSLPMAGCSGNEENKTDAGSNASANGSNAPAESGTAAKKDNFVIAMGSDLKSLDPHATNDSVSSTIQNHMFSRLVELDEKGNIQGDLAESFEYVTDTQLHIKLREGVKFHDGSEVKASDVKFSLEREKQGARTAYLVSSIDNIEVVDDYNLNINLSAVDSSLLFSLAQSGSSILPEKLVTEQGEKFFENPIGSGPLKYTEWVPNDHITLSRFDDYYAGAPKAASIVWRIIPEGSSRTIALENGEIDMLASVDAVDVSRVLENTNLETKLLDSTGVEYLGFNFNKKPFDDVRVRQAIAYGINKEDIVEVVYEGRGAAANTVLSPAIPGMNTSIEGYPYNPEKAKELLKEAGQENLSFTIKTSGDARNRQAQLIQANMQEIGVNVEIELLDWGAYLESINSGDMETYIISWSNSTMDPAESLTPLFHSKNWGPTGNRMYYKNEEVDKMLDEMVGTNDAEKRMELVNKIQEQVVADCPWATLCSRKVCVAYRKGIQGIKVMPNEQHRYENMSM